jgi:hypothetical protein
MKKTKSKVWGINLSIFAAVGCFVLCLVLLDPINPGNIAFSQQPVSNASDYMAIRDQYLKSWEKLDFQSVFDTYVIGGSDTAFGVYEARPTNTFSPGETLFLYAEPVGYSFSPIQDGRTTLYSFNMAADIIILDSTGQELTSINDLPVSNVVSHQKNTEVFLSVTLSQSEPFPKGDYTIKYVITDSASAESFEIVKEISIA